MVDSGGRPSPRGASLSFWDEANREWVGIAQNAVPHWIPTREIARFASSDLKHWRSDIVLAPDPEDSTNPTRYDEPMSLDPFYSEGILFGLLSWFHSDRTTPDGGLVLDRNSPQVQNWQQGWPTPTTAQNPFVWPFARKGVNEMRITLSHDGGKSWDRTASRVAWIPHGTEEDSYDRLVLSACPPVRVNDEDWFYLGVWSGDHLSTRADAEQRPYYHDRMRQGRIALYTQKHNRYVSLRTGSQRETLITRPFKLEGDTLQLNVDASRGRVRVEIAEYKPVSSLSKRPGQSASTSGAMSVAPHLLMEQNSLPGFGFDDCQPILANSTECKTGRAWPRSRGRPSFSASRCSTPTCTGSACAEGRGDQAYFAARVEPCPFLNGANIFVYLPAGWKIGTALPAAGAGRFRAEDYDHLIDCPVEISAFDEFAFKLRGVDFRRGRSVRSDAGRSTERLRLHQAWVSRR
ncbi:MAG: hypothetical protein DMG07_18585 [Acidobacteria bacterium]|nr:MAG: hypothetical protein DMG07_18585 [Acidobacteriota bacterium]